ncbi:MAG: ROK family protein [Segniliparus sp.]|uniref:ROK family protein n=1 Tax=Segniliparus sp. TaxID=2804064 RepID=UPI003F2E6BDF
MASPLLSPTRVPSPSRLLVRPETAVRGETAVRLRPVGLPVRRDLGRVVQPRLGFSDVPASAVLHAARGKGAVSRDVLAKSTDLSVATVNRQVVALLEAGLLRERADLAPSGLVGRPRVPVEVDHEPYLVLGVYVGLNSVSIVAGDIRGKVLDSAEFPTPRGNVKDALEQIASSARQYLVRWPRRRPLWAGVASVGSVDPVAGTTTRAELGWKDAPLAGVVSAKLGLPTSLAVQVEAVAAAELLLPPSNHVVTSPVRERTTLHFYGRESLGTALTIGGRVHSPKSGPGTISHLPVRSKLLLGHEGAGALADAVSDSAVALAWTRLTGAKAHPRSAQTVQDVIRQAAAGDSVAQELLGERSRLFGESVAIAASFVNPDEVVLGGQAFTSYPEAAEQVAKAFQEASATPGVPVRVTRLGSKVQEFAALAVALSAVWADPIGAWRQAGLAA